MKKYIMFVLMSITLFGFNSIQNANPNNSITGKVVRAYVSEGYGKMRHNWLFMDIATKNGIVTVAIAPTFKISNLPINEGDEVRVSGVNPPMFPRGVIKAFDIYDITQKRDYPISGYGYHYNNWYFHH